MPENEQNYDFRKRLKQVHVPRRVAGKQQEADEIRLDSHWRIVMPKTDDVYFQITANDFQDYLHISMELDVKIAQQTELDDGAEATVILGTRQQLPGKYSEGLTKSRGYRLTVTERNIVVCGYDTRGVAQGCYRLEDIMNLREAPFVKRQSTLREPLFSPRMIHSGWGIDNFPNEHLNGLAHAGMDAILVFVTGINRTQTGPLDFQDLIDRAALYGIDVYFYSYLKNRKHPDEPDAPAFYEDLYGTLIKTFPRVKGIVFVGESCEIPSKDERTKGRLRLDPVPPGMENDTRPNTGWWPCRDYPQWLNMVKGIMRKYNPDLDIIFWTYNWGWAPVGPRLELIRNLPKDISLQATFEMFENVDKDGVPTRLVDYTASFAGPGYYFRTEAEEAKRQNIPLYSMTNTGGLTWDIGVIPYEPIPYQWKNRWDAMLKAHDEWGLVGLMESHHFGWYPSFITELSKEAFWSNGDDFDTHIARIAERDFGKEHVTDALEAWRCWSSAFQDYPTTNEDQYGPFRVGPSYPLLFRDQMVQFPADPRAHFGARIVTLNYRSHNPGILSGEIGLLEKMEAKMLRGVELLKKANSSTPLHRQEEVARMIGLGEFIARTVHTTKNTKKWHLCNRQLADESLAADTRRDTCRRMLELAKDELDNVQGTIPLVRRDSRLGWEPSMEYMCDEAHLQWKADLLKQLLDTTIPQYLKEI